MSGSFEWCQTMLPGGLLSLIQIYSWMDGQQQIPGRDLRCYETVHKYKIKKNMVKKKIHRFSPASLTEALIHLLPENNWKSEHTRHVSGVGE